MVEELEQITKAVAVAIKAVAIAITAAEVVAEQQKWSCPQSSHDSGTPDKYPNNVTLITSDRPL